MRPYSILFIFFITVTILLMMAVKFGKLKAAPQISVVALNPSVMSAPIGIIGKIFVTSVTKKFVDTVLKKKINGLL